MSYEIIYDISGKMKRLPRWKKHAKLLAIALAVVVVLTAFAMPFHTTWQSTRNALDVFANNLEQGSGIADAFSEFCFEILNDAKIN